MLTNCLFCIALVLFVILLYMLYGRHGNNSIDNNDTTLPKNINDDIEKKINRAVEEGYQNAAQNISNGVSGGISIAENNIISENEKNIIKHKLVLFYKPSCKYCKEFMPLWMKIINTLPKHTTYEEINCEDNTTMASKHKITSVPTLILFKNIDANGTLSDDKFYFMGLRTYTNIENFLRMHNIYLNKTAYNKSINSIESFTQTVGDGYGSGEDDGYGDGQNEDNYNTKNKMNPNCPAVTFDKQIDIENDTYMYQIFNENGQYGYATGGYGDGQNNKKPLTPFLAAYSTIDSYLSSLPSPEHKTINECALLYADNIINFGLCDNEELDKILTYTDDVNKGIKINKHNANYSTNPAIVNSIKEVCGFLP